MLDIPDSPKLYTTMYSGFKGVDYTNDVTTIYKKRSPDAINIMPDESGNPVKRFGWETVLTEVDFQNAVTGGYSGEIEILRCYYFTLSGVDHIMIFTSAGLFCYKDDALSLLEDDGGIIDSVDRAYFFEGNGDAAFYIYSNYAGVFKVWKYTYDDGLDELGMEELTIPLIRYAQSANGDKGDLLYSYNLLGEYVQEQFLNNDFNGAGTYAVKKVVLSHDIAQEEVTSNPKKVKVYAFNQNTGDFDTELTVLPSNQTLETNKCRLLSNQSGGVAHIEFYDQISGITGEDSIRVIYRVLDTTTTVSSTSTVSGKATLNGGN